LWEIYAEEKWKEEFTEQWANGNGFIAIVGGGEYIEFLN